MLLYLLSLAFPHAPELANSVDLLVVQQEKSSENSLENATDNFVRQARKITEEVQQQVLLLLVRDDVLPHHKGKRVQEVLVHSHVKAGR